MSQIPRGLPDFAKRIWREVREELDEDWIDGYAPLLERYARKLALAAEKTREAEAEPYTAGSTGQLVPHPAWKIAREAELDAHRYAEALLLTPAARKRHAKESKEREGNDLGF